MQCLTKCICQDPRSWPSAHIPSILGDAPQSRQYISETAPLPRDLQTGLTPSVRGPSDTNPISPHCAGGCSEAKHASLQAASWVS